MPVRKSPGDSASCYSDIFGAASYLDAFDTQRKLRQEVINLWCEHVEAVASTLRAEFATIADLGSGVGRFSIPFAQRLSRSNGRIIAVDKSVDAIRLLNKRALELNVKNIQASCQDICTLQLSQKANVFFMSEMLHCVDSIGDVFNEMRYASTTNAAVIIRVPSHRQLSEISWLRLFPAALKLDVARTPPIDAVLDELYFNGFRGKHSVATVVESQSLTADEFIGSLERKAYSILRLIAEEEFEKGLAAARQFVKNKEMVETHHNMTRITVLK